MKKRIYKGKNDSENRLEARDKKTSDFEERRSFSKKGGLERDFETKKNFDEHNKFANKRLKKNDTDSYRQLRDENDNHKPSAFGDKQKLKTASWKKPSYDKKPYEKKPFNKTGFKKNDFGGGGERVRDGGYKGGEVEGKGERFEARGRFVAKGSRPYDKKPYERKPFNKTGFKKNDFGGGGDERVRDGGYKGGEVEGKGERFEARGRFAAKGSRPYDKKPYEKKPFNKTGFKKNDFGGGERVRDGGYKGGEVEGKGERFEARGRFAAKGSRPYDKKPYERKPFNKTGFKKNDFDGGEGEDGNKPFKKTLKSFEKNTSRFESKGEELMPLNKFLAHCGICSRREAVDLVKFGTVQVNDAKVLEPGFKIDPQKDVVTYRNNQVKIKKDYVYILLNKPKDYITTLDDPQERKTVLELTKGLTTERVYPVGRLDRNTTGVLLMTNDGELTQKLTHPKYQIKKIYHVTLDRDLTNNDIQKILKGVELEDGLVEVDDLAFVSDKQKNELGIEIHSGKNRVIRRLFEKLNYEVVALDRVVFAELTKKNLPRGKARFLSEKEVVRLKYLNNSKGQKNATRLK